jgi:hypothetical protein
MNEIPAAGVQPQPSPSEDLVRRLSLTAAGSTAWMKFLAVMLIIGGVILIVSLWGILICWLPIWAAVLLLKASGDADMASRGAPAKLLDFVQKTNKFFMITGIFFLVLIIILTVLFVIAGLAILMGFGGFM